MVHLPSSYCHYTLAELMRGQIKDYVAETGTTFKTVDIKNVMWETVDFITILAWDDCVMHAKDVREIFL